MTSIFAQIIVLRAIAAYVGLSILYGGLQLAKKAEEEVIILSSPAVLRPPFVDGKTIAVVNGA